MRDPDPSGQSHLLVTLFMIVTERDHLIANYAIRSLGKIYESRLPYSRNFVLHVYLNCLTTATKRGCLAAWQSLPWVEIFDNEAKVTGQRFEKGESILSPEGVPRPRDDSNENYDELWSTELKRFHTKYVGTVDADFEVTEPRLLFFHALRIGAR